MAINEEEVKIRERLTSLETKLSFIQNLLQEIRDELKDQPTKEDYELLAARVTDLEKAQNKLAVKVGIASGIIGLVFGLLFKFFMG